MWAFRSGTNRDTNVAISRIQVPYRPLKCPELQRVDTWHGDCIPYDRHLKPLKFNTSVPNQKGV